MRSKALRIGALFVLALPLQAEQCSETTKVQFSLGFPIIVTATAEGEINDKDGIHSVQVVNVKDEVDVKEALIDAGYKAEDIPLLPDDNFKVVQVFYRVNVPDQVANRRIIDGNVTVQRILADGTPDPAGPAILITDFTANAGVGNVVDPQKWIDGTKIIGQPGLDLLNGYLVDCMEFVKNGTPMPSEVIQTVWDGVSDPVDQETLFGYQFKIVLQGVVEIDQDVPLGGGTTGPS